MSKREDKILGISTIIAQFGELLQKWEADFEEVASAVDLPDMREKENVQKSSA